MFTGAHYHEPIKWITILCILACLGLVCGSTESKSALMPKKASPQNSTGNSVSHTVANLTADIPVVLPDQKTCLKNNRLLLHNGRIDLTPPLAAIKKTDTFQQGFDDMKKIGESRRPTRRHVSFDDSFLSDRKKSCRPVFSVDFEGLHAEHLKRNHSIEQLGAGDEYEAGSQDDFDSEEQEGAQEEEQIEAKDDTGCNAEGGALPEKFVEIVPATMQEAAGSDDDKKVVKGNDFRYTTPPLRPRTIPIGEPILLPVELKALRQEQKTQQQDSEAKMVQEGVIKKEKEEKKEHPDAFVTISLDEDIQKNNDAARLPTAISAVTPHNSPESTPPTIPLSLPIIANNAEQETTETACESKMNNVALTQEQPSPPPSVTQEPAEQEQLLDRTDQIMPASRHLVNNRQPVNIRQPVNNETAVTDTFIIDKRVVWGAACSGIALFVILAVVLVWTLQRALSSPDYLSSSPSTKVTPTGNIVSSKDGSNLTAECGGTGPISGLPIVQRSRTPRPVMMTPYAANPASFQDDTLTGVNNGGNGFLLVKAPVPKRMPTYSRTPSPRLPFFPSSNDDNSNNNSSEQYDVSASPGFTLRRVSSTSPVNISHPSYLKGVDSYRHDNNTPHHPATSFLSSPLMAEEKELRSHSQFSTSTVQSGELLLNQIDLL